MLLSWSKRALLGVAAIAVVTLAVVAQKHEGSLALFDAALKGETDVVRQAVEEGADPNQKDQSGKSLLAYSAIGGHKDTVIALLAMGAKPNADGGLTLFSACMENHTEISRILVEAGADVNLISGDKYKRTPLYEACRNDNLELAQYLLDRGADPNTADHMYLFGWTPLMLAAQSNAKLTELLIKKGAKVDQRSYTGYTALWVACRAGEPGSVKALLAAGAEVDARDSKDGITPLCQAAAEGHTDIVNLLLQAGADPNARAIGRLNFTPLMAAARSGDIESVRLLLKAKADPKATDDEGHTALMYATIKGNASLMEELVHAGVPVDAADDTGETALFAASREGNSEAMKALVKLGANPGQKNKAGKIPKDYAPSHQLPGAINPDKSDTRRTPVPSPEQTKEKVAE